MRQMKFLSAIALVAFTISSCGDDDPTNDGENGGDNPGSTTQEQYTPEESKEFLQDTAEEVMSLFDPTDQSEVIDLAGYFSEKYGWYDMPDEFNVEEDDERYTYANPASFFSAILQGVKGDAGAVSRAGYVYTYTYKVNFEKFAGIYEPKDSWEQWEKVGNSKDIIFRFKDAKGSAVELKATRGDGNSQVNIEYSEDDYYSYEYYYYLSIPKQVDVTLTLGGKTLANITIISAIDIEEHKFSIDVDATVANLRVKAVTNGKDTKIDAWTELTVSGKKVATGNVELNGSNLCNVDRISDDFRDNPGGFIKTASAKADVLGKVQAFGDGKYYDGMDDDLDAYEYGYGKSNLNTAKMQIDEACSRLNKNITAIVKYNGSGTTQCSFEFVPSVDKWGDDNWDIGVGQDIVFSDGTSYNIESYFEEFISVSDQFENILDAYESAWRKAIR